MDQSEWTNQIAVGFPTMQSGKILQSDCSITCKVLILMHEVTSCPHESTVQDI